MSDQVAGPKNRRQLPPGPAPAMATPTAPKACSAQETNARPLRDGDRVVVPPKSHRRCLRARSREAPRSRNPKPAPDGAGGVLTLSISGWRAKRERKQSTHKTQAHRRCVVLTKHGGVGNTGRSYGGTTAAPHFRLAGGPAGHVSLSFHGLRGEIASIDIASFLPPKRTIPTFRPHSPVGRRRKTLAIAMANSWTRHCAESLVPDMFGSTKEAKTETA